MYYFFNRFRIVVLGGALLNLIPTLPVGHQEAQIGSDGENSANCE